MNDVWPFLLPFAAALLLYLIGFFVGGGPEARDNGTRGRVPMLIGAGGVFFVFNAAQGTTDASGATGVAIWGIMILLSALFFFGLGRFVASTVRAIPTAQSRRLAIRLGVFLPVLLSCTAAFAVERRVNAALAAEAQAIAAFQATSLSGEFGPYQVEFPAAPQLHLVHQCGTRNRDCHTHIWSRASINRAEPDALVLTEVWVRDFPEVASRRAAWCTESANRSPTPWCADDLPGELVFHLDEQRQDLTGTNWTSYPSPPGTTAQWCIGEGIDRHCRVIIPVVPLVSVEFNTTGLSAEAVADLVPDAAERAQAIWAAMTDH